MASPDSSAGRALSKSSSIRYSAPKLGALALSRIDWPEMADGVLDARRLQGDLLDLLHDLLRARRPTAASGSCTLTSR